MTSAMANAPVPNPWPPIPAQRQFADGVQASLGEHLQKRYGVRVETSVIGGVPVRIIYPKDVKVLGSGPVLLNLHGGGFYLDSGSLTETIPIAALTDIPVVAVLYRLAPEHPYPAAVDDALAVYQALERDAKTGGIAVYGTSAGAGLSAQLVARLVKLGQPVPAAMGFFSGSADLSKVADSETWQPLPNGGKTLVASMPGYVGNTPLNDPGLSPVYSDLSRFPPTLAVSSTRDIMLSGTSNFARALTEHGVDARLVVFDGLPHAFWSYMPIPETDEANNLMARFLKSHVQRTKR
jgi:acetyl esterase/lipase